MNQRMALFVMATALVPVVTVEAAHIARVQPAARPEFPIRRHLPAAVVRPTHRVIVRPRAYLAPVEFGAVIVPSLARARGQVWEERETLKSRDGWTDFTMNVGLRGRRLVLGIDRGAAQISFAEVVFDNGESQVIDFNDQTERTGLYTLLGLSPGRTIDHVRVVAKADSRASELTLRLTT